jgi:GT2 family glycosyltransferase
MYEGKTVVLVTVRAEFERHGWWHPLLGAWLLSLIDEPTYAMAIELVNGYAGYAASANACATAFLEKFPDADWLCIVDNDTVPPHDILRILDTAPDEADIISPLCHMVVEEKVYRQAGHYEVEAGERRFLPLTSEATGICEVDRVGGGCWFIRRQVFGKMEKPYFRILFNPDTYQLIVSDDIFFQTEAKNRGLRIFCDTRYECSHYHTRDLSI